MLELCLLFQLERLLWFLEDVSIVKSTFFTRSKSTILRKWIFAHLNSKTHFFYFVLKFIKFAAYLSAIALNFK